MACDVVCTPEARFFSRAEEFLALLAPRTGLGKAWVESFPVSSDPEVIGERLDDVGTVLGFLAAVSPLGDAAAVSGIVDRLSWHLERIPRLPENFSADALPFSRADLFAVRKFVSCHRFICTLLDEPVKERFVLTPGFGILDEELGRGASGPETFYLSGAMDERLARVREQISRVDAGLLEERERVASLVREVAGLDFRGLEFLIVPHEKAQGLFSSRELLAVSSWDDRSWKVTLQASERELALEDERMRLGSVEAEVEEAVLCRLSALVASHAAGLEQARHSILRFDRALAAALLAQKLSLTRPVFSGVGEVLDLATARGAQGTQGGGESVEIALEGGIFLPCEATCLRVGSDYVPLDLTLSEPVAIVRGSNMGGKTVALRTLLFLQVIAQMGLYVPARRFVTRIRPVIHFVGDVSGMSGGGQGNGGRTLEREGLSGFGFEIAAFIEARRLLAGGGMVVFDEFARTTGAREAEALVAACIEAFSRSPGLLALFATHSVRIPRGPGRRFLRVPGLDRCRAARVMAGDSPLEERIRTINGLMRFGLEEDADDELCPEALAVARLLGLEPAIAGRAEEFFAANRIVVKEPLCR